MNSTLKTGTENIIICVQIVSGDSLKGLHLAFLYHLGFQGREEFYYEKQRQKTIF